VRRGAPVVTASRQLAPGRSTITLAGLVRGRSYRLTLSFVTGDGQSATDVATLRVRSH
jgi:hypothetical protein